MKYLKLILNYFKITDYEIYHNKTYHYEMIFSEIHSNPFGSVIYEKAIMVN